MVHLDMELLTHSSAWIALTFSSDTVVTSISHNMVSSTGYSNHEMIGRPITQFLADRTVFEIPSILGTVKNTGRWEGEFVYRDCNGSAIAAYGIVMPLSDNGGGNSGYLLLSKVTDSMSSEDGPGSKYEDVGSHLRTLVHDLNNPLAVIMGSTQLMALNAGCTGKVRSDIEKLYEELERMARIVEKLHSYAVSLCGKSSDSSAQENPMQNSA